MVSTPLALFNFVEYRKEKSALRVQSFIKDQVQNNLRDDEWEKLFFFEGQKVSVEYTFQESITNYVKKFVKRYRPDYVSTVIIDNNTGKILTAIDYSRQEKAFSRALSFSSTHPSASIFKIVSAADLIENTELSSDSKIPVNGKSTTLYKYQLKDRRNRWTRDLPLEKAFALSHNPAFGKAAIQESSPESLYKMGVAFGFNKQLMDDIDLSTSHLGFPNSEYNLAEISSGFNRKTLMSPLHGAVIASVVANDGVLRTPYLIDKIVRNKEKEVVYQAVEDERKVIDNTTAGDLQEMMMMTVSRGTAKSAFLRIPRKYKDALDIGGKTGSITGGEPHGKRDWFVAWAKPKNSDDKGISVCVMIVNQKKWYVKASYMTRKIIESFFKEKDEIFVSLVGNNGKSKI